MVSRYATCGITKAPPPSTDPFASRRSVTPISRGHANALGFQHPGAFSFWRAHKETTRFKRDCIALPKHPDIAGPRQGNTAKAQGCAVPGCFGTGGKRMQSHTDWRFRCDVGDANAEHRRTIHSGMGSQDPSGARGTAVAYAGDRKTVFREATLAQLGRAAAKAVGRRFESGTSPLDSSVG